MAVSGPLNNSYVANHMGEILGEKLGFEVKIEKTYDPLYNNISIKFGIVDNKQLLCFVTYDGKDISDLMNQKDINNIVEMFYIEHPEHFV